MDHRRQGEYISKATAEPSWQAYQGGNSAKVMSGPRELGESASKAPGHQGSVAPWPSSSLADLVVAKAWQLVQTDCWGSRRCIQVDPKVHHSTWSLLRVGTKPIGTPWRRDAPGPSVPWECDHLGDSAAMTNGAFYAGHRRIPQGRKEPWNRGAKARLLAI